MLRTSLVCSVLLLGACGDNGGGGAADAPPTPIPDAPPPPIDAVACDPTGYPAMVRAQSVDLIAPTTLTLDGTGTRCEQLIRALTAPTGRPPELELLDADGVTGTCFHDDVLNREIVRLSAPLYAGQPIYAPIQDVLAHVDQTDTVVFLHGDFLPAGYAPGPGCLDGNAAAALMPGRPMAYQRFSTCIPQGEGSYTIAGDDELDIGEEGFYLDRDGNLRRVRAIDVYLLPANVTTEVTNSDAFCCSGPTIEHCIGQRMFVDAFTGEVIAQTPHCHTC